VIGAKKLEVDEYKDGCPGKREKQDALLLPLSERE
jgi:hypothetical protein